MEGLGGIERAGGNEHRRQADQRMEGRNQLRHGSHRDAPGDEGADGAADSEAADDKP